ncbi:non-ribosomal peptide synthase/polyketide synthase [Chitinophaga sp. HK235]|uniref:non-ribosomal peptide synthase/polyketide synthase n=1 Tax=Chitinophaga sp. HK235 TaxID=2952571 RepID=UPI001BA65417|nr:non-ribosomal peptide synthase/polyketide synthase [Chitinophaga sp. HK235]
MEKKYLPISQYQRSFFVEWALAPESSIYNVSKIYAVDGMFNKDVFIAACSKLIKDDDILHATFSEDGTTCYYNNFPIEDFIIDEATDDIIDIREQLLDIINRPFDLVKGPLLRIHLLDNTSRDGKSYIAFCMNHIIADGIGFESIISKVSRAWTAQVLHLPDEPVVSPSRIACIEKEKRLLTPESSAAARQFWHDYIGELPLVADLPIMKHAAQEDTAGETLFFELTGETLTALHQYTKRHKVSIFTILAAVYGVVVSRYCSQPGIILSYAVNMRPPGFPDITGSFVNNLPLKIETDKYDTLIALIKALVSERKEVKPHQHYVLSEIIHDQRKIKEEDSTDYFNVGFTETYMSSVPISLEGLHVEEIDFPLSNESIYWMSLMYDRRNKDAFKFRLIYRKNIISSFVAEGVIRSFLELLRKTVTVEDLPLKDYCLLNSSDYSNVLYNWNATTKPYASGKTIHQLFEEQVALTPDATALVYGNSQLTYHELNERANRLAAYLQATYAIRPDELVALCLSRSEHLVIAVLAVLKSGAAYVPIDPGFPSGRITWILSDTAARVVLTNESYAAALDNDLSLAVESIDSIEFQSMLGETYSGVTPETISQAGDLAYVIYTSGTTGQPKGVMVEHNSVINLITEMIEIHQLDKYRNIGCYSNYVFDAFVYETFPVLCNGNCLYLYSDEIRNAPDELVAYAHQHHIAVSFIPPVLLPAFAAMDAGFQLIFTGGEKLPDLKKPLQAVLINEYGPTEATVCATFHRCTDDNNRIIGRPVANTTLYVLDSHLIPVPVGATGELYIGGAGVTRGYLNQPELTQERFLANPFQTASEKEKNINSRIYKTGDLVRYLPDGNLEYIGRNDFQVKIRGHRIEPGEIENRLSAFPEIRQAAMVVKNRASGSGNYLAAYYVSDHEIEPQLLLDYLAEHLPDYMVPAALIHLTSLPLTVNGKLNYRALPEPQLPDSAATQTAENDTERVLCEIYAEVLGLNTTQVGVHDDFFRLGGDSIVSILLVSRLRQRAGINVNVKDIFRNRTIRQLYTHKISKSVATIPAVVTEQGILTGKAGLLPVQAWFFDQVACGTFPAFHHWNQSFLIHVPPLNKELLGMSILKLINYHDGLRFYYPVDKEVAGGYVQHYGDEVNAVMIKYLDIATMDNEELTAWQAGFNISEGPLLQVGYLEGFADGSARIYFAAHHLLLDTVSWRIICEDTEKIYNYLLEAQQNQAERDFLATVPATVILGSKGSSYRQWVNAVAAYAPTDGKTAEDELAWWSAINAGIPAGNALLSAMRVEMPARTTFSLDHQLTECLLREVGHVYQTQVNDILLSALGIALSSLTGFDHHHVLLEGHGREFISPSVDVTHTTGWFTTMYPVEIVTPAANIATQLVTVKEMLRSIPSGGLGYGALQGYTTSALPLISFNYLGQFDRQRPDGAQGWYISGESSGQFVSAANHPHTLIDFLGRVVDGCLQFDISGNIPVAALSALAENYRAALETIVHYLKSSPRSYLTVSDIDHIISAQYLDKLQADREITNVYLAGSLQEGFISHALNQGAANDAYGVQLVWEYRCPLQETLLQQAWQYAPEKFNALRLRFHWEEELIQVIDKKGIFPWRYEDISHLPENEQDAYLQHLLAEDKAVPFELSAGNLYRIYLIKKQTDRYAFIFSNHHAILDGWSMSLLLSFVHDVYRHLQKGQPYHVEPDHAYTAAQHYLQQHRQQHDAYWNARMAQLSTREDLSSLLRPEQRHIVLSDYRHVRLHQELTTTVTGERYQALKRFCSAYGFTLNAVLQYCWHRLLSIYGNSNTTVVGMTMAGRNLPVDDIELSVGLFINTLPVIMEHDAGTVVAAISKLQAHINDANSHTVIQLSRLQQEGRRLFNTLFVFENYPVPLDRSGDELPLYFKESTDQLDYPLGVILVERPGEVLLRLKYAGELFSSETIHQLLEGVFILLDQLLADPHIETSQLTFITPEQQQLLITDWNKTAEDYPLDKTIQQLFEEQVRKTPDHTALVYENHRLSYRELNEKANQVAAYLHAQYAVKPDDLIGLYLERTEYMIIAILGVLKSGAAYVPVDLTYPDDRVAYILSDAGARVVLTDSMNEENLQRIMDSLPVIVEIVEDICHASPKSISSPGLQTSGTSANMCFVLYTSGTTGNPKGVMIEHRNELNIIYGIRDAYEFSHQARIVLFATYVFDMSVSEILSALLFGNTLYVLGTKVRTDVTAVSQYLLDHEINYVYLPPVMLAALPRIAYPHLRGITYAGEPCDQETGKYWASRLRLYNYYGPTETNIATGKLIVGGDTHLIGRPIGNTSCYVVDSALRPLPLGAIGELYIGGAAVARGYFNLPELTQQRFIANPFQSDEEKEKNINGRLYKTGDLVRYHPDGNLEYIGRNDFQVKIRGYRIEPGEVESRLNAYPAIRQAVVLVKEHPGGGKYLAGYYVADEMPDQDAVRSYLEAYLPDYMVPAALIYMPEFPVTVNGKLDRRALPEPAFTGISSYQAPENETELKLTGVFAAVLGLEATKISVQDDFFRLGGNSILAIRLINKLNAEMKSGLHVAEVFNCRTIRRLAEALLEGTGGSVRITAPVIVSPDEQLLSFSQERLWFIDRYERGTHAFNLPLVLRLEPDLDKDLMLQALHAVVHRHEVLRSIVTINKEGKACQQVMDDAVRPLTIETVESYSRADLDDQLSQQAGRVFRLDEEYPLHACLYTLHRGGSRGNEYYLGLVLHHIASDGWSEDILLHELQQYYHHYTNNPEQQHSDPVLPPLPVQYRDYALWQRNYLQGPVLERQLHYWKQQLAGYETLYLPADKPRPAKVSYEGATISFTLDKTLSNDLRAVSRNLEVSMYSLLLGGYYLLLSGYSNQQDIIVGSPVSNRHHGDIAHLIGSFVNMLPLRMQIDPEQPLTDFIRQVSTAVIDAQLHQDLPFEKLVEELHTAPDLSRHPIFQVMFSVQHFGGDTTSGNPLFTRYTTPDADYFKIAKHDLSIYLDDSEETITGMCNYSVHLFELPAIERYVAVYKEILQQLAQLNDTTQTSRRIRSLRYLDSQQYQQFVYELNNTLQPYPSGKAIQQLFEAQVEKTPAHIAVKYADRSLTYATLNEQANRLAAYLRERYHPQPDDRIALYMDRSEHMIVAILAILKSGAAYVPIDIAYPADRVGYILSDASARAVLVSDRYREKLLEITIDRDIDTIVTDNAAFQYMLAGYPVDNPLCVSHGGHLAYVMYTSGTTGIPKGVMVEHKSVNRLVKNVDYVKIAEEDSILGISNYAFDGSVFDIFGALLNGATLVVVDKDVLQDMRRFDHLLDTHRITVFFITTALFNVLAEEGLPGLKHLKYILFGGELVSLKHVLAFHEKYSHVNLVHVYGPTESTTFATSFLCNNQIVIATGTVPIGRPLSNTTAYVLDTHLNPLPPGATGELYVGGEGVARGYLNMPELTAARFIPNPFRTAAEKEKHINSHLYKTGDLVKYLPDGNIEYISRTDFQVKIRGYRIELGEIVHRMETYPGIRQAFVVVKEKSHGDKYLAGYYVADTALDQDVLLGYIGAYLPAYMVPLAMIHLPELPLTINGKVDHRLLPEPVLTNTGHYQQPENETEERLCVLFGEILGLDAGNIDVEEDFFRLGGNSILAIRLVNRLNAEWETGINLADVFTGGAVRKLAQQLQDSVVGHVKILPQEITDPEQQLLSFAQERLWFIENYEGGSNAYNIPLVLKLQPGVNPESMLLALRAVVHRHEVLRSVIRTGKHGDSYQEVLDDIVYPLPVIRKEVATIAALDEMLSALTHHVFKLEEEYPVAAGLYALNKEYYLGIVLHHIAFDGWSATIFLREIQQYYHHYQELATEERHLPAPLTLQYKDFALWQRSYLAGEVLTEQLAYWKEQLTDYETLQLPADKPRPAFVNYEGATILFTIDKITSDQLKALSRELEVSTFSLLLSAYYLLLSGYSGQRDIVVGSPVSNRHYSEIADLIGFFVNTLALRQEINPEQRITDFIRQVGASVITAQLHQDLPFEKLVDELKIEPDASRHPVYQVIFSVQHFGEEEANELFIPFYQNQHHNIAKYDLGVALDDSGEEIRGVFNYATGLFNAATIEGYITVYKEILGQLVQLHNKDQQHLPLKSVHYLNREQQAAMLYDQNNTASAFPTDKTLHKLFEEQAAATPEQVALISGDLRLTYRELNEKANQLAAYLRQQYDIQPGDLIGLYLDRSEYMLIAILGVLKSGAAYVPVDIAYPEERINYILTDISPRVIVTGSIYQDKLEKIQTSAIIAIDSEAFENALSVCPVVNPAPLSGAEDLAYVMYTSGTTGLPKGVMVTHRNVCRLVKNTDYVSFEATDRILGISNYAFDGSVFDIFGPLLHGAALVIAAREVFLDTALLQDTITRYDISVIFITTPLFHTLVDVALPCLKNLRLILAGGEQMSNTHVKKFLEAEGNAVLKNVYGPTETTTFATAYECKAGHPLPAIIPIGRPIANTTTYILDASLRPVPAGATGELYIGGEGVARGYLNKTTLTEERFIANPFRTEKEKQDGLNARLYKTGDLVKGLPDGNIVFLGRNDTQVKVRGYRMELSEIEGCLFSFPGIKQAVVVVREQEGGTRYLAGYYVADDAPDQDVLQRYLGEFLPEYMVPQALMRLEKLPLNINGKLERRALPDPQLTNQRTYEAPANATEEKLCVVFGEVLNIDPSEISVHDDFFRLGGNSILIIRLVNRLNALLDSHVSVAAVFTERTVRNIAVRLQRTADHSVKITAPVVTSPEEQLLSFAQERLWFIENYEGGSNAYNVPLVMQLHPAVDKDLLLLALQAVIRRHEVLRSVIRINHAGTGYQQVLDAAADIIQEVVSDDEALDIALAAQASDVFKLDKEPPLKIALYTLYAGDATEHYLSLVLHHIAFDGWSTDILLRDLFDYYKYYEALAVGEIVQAPAPLSLQYKDFALWQRHYLKGAVLHQQLSYWSNKLSGYETLHLPTDKPRPAHFNYTGADIPFVIDKATSEGLRAISRELEVSLYSVLLSGYYLLLSAYSHQRDIVVGSPVANRHYGEIADLIGFFVNTLVLREEIDPNQRITDFIRQVGASVMDAQLHQDLPFEKLLDELQVEPDVSRHPVVQTVFGMHHFGGTDATGDLFIPYNNSEHYHIAKYDLSTYLDDSSEEITGLFNYAVSLFEATTIQGYITTYKEILQQLAVAGKELQIKSLRYQSATERTTSLAQWNNPLQAFPTDRPVHRLFEEQAAAHPERTAVVFEDIQLSYAELNTRADELATYIRYRYQLRPDDLVGICLDRSEHMLIAILAVLKAGAAYVPMDPAYPEERIAYILSDTGTKVVLTNEKQVARLSALSAEITAEAIDNRHFVSEQSTLPPVVTTPEQLAYVIYTSGTTGQPKGAMIEHRNVSRLFHATAAWYHFDASDVWTLFHSVVFDFSVWEIWGALCYGGKLVIPSTEQTKDPSLFYDLCEREGVTVLNQTPGAFYQFIAASQQKPVRLTQLRYVIFGGDALNLAQLKLWYDLYTDDAPRLINMYGITETTVHVTWKALRASELDKGSLIGRVIPDLQAYVLNEYLEPLPQGAVGELYVGGAGVCRGYLNLPSLTATRFITDPFTGGDARLYKTGDLVRQLPNGDLEYIGRADFQVKIRGYRIELGEIEHRIASYPGIKQAVVLVKEQAGGNKYLAAYYVADEPLNHESILEYLGSYLPEYMLPAVLVHLPQLPLTINGKLDRRALPEPVFTDSDHYRAPENNTEATMCAIYGQVLGISADKIGVDDDFFRLGGDSIVSIQLVSRLRQQAGIHITVKDIFRYRTIALLYTNVIAAGTTSAVQLETEQGILSGEVPLLPIQRWFFTNVSNGLLPKYHHWNQSFLISVPVLDITLLEYTLTVLLNYHDGLRLRYRPDSTQYYSEEVTGVDIRRLDIHTLETPEALHTLLSSWQADFDIYGDRLLQAGYLEGYADGRARLFLAVHHLLIDTVSWRMLVADMERIYNHLSTVTTTDTRSLIGWLGPKGSSYRQWTTLVSGYELSVAEQDYWSELLPGIKAGNAVLSGLAVKHTSHAQLTLDAAYTGRLLRESHHVYNTQINDILLSALGVALSRITGEKNHYILLESHGREMLSASIDITHTSGWFTTMYPVQIISEGDDYGAQLVSAKETLRAVPANGIGYGILTGYHPEGLPRISFNYLGQFDGQESADSSGWQLTGEDSGRPIDASNGDHHLININGFVMGGRLQFNITGNIAADLLTTLAAEYQRELEKMIEWLGYAPRTWLTASDTDNIISNGWLSVLQSQREVSGVYSAGSLQEGFIYHALHQGDVDDAYRVQLSWDYHNVINPGLLEQAWQYAQQRYSALRLRFAWEHELVQIIDRHGHTDWHYQDISHQDKASQEVYLNELMVQDRTLPFDLSAGNLFRIYLVKRGEHEWSCLFSNHHAILDGWSMPLLLNYVHEVYLQLLQGVPVVVREDQSYAEAQRYLQQHRQDNEAYWTAAVAQLEGQEDLSYLLRADQRHIRLSAYRHILQPAEKALWISGTRYEALKRLCATNGVTLNAVLQYCWHRQLSLYGNSRTTVVGMTVSGRNLPINDIEQSVGLYINTLPVIMEHGAGSVISAIRHLQNHISEVNSRSDIHLGKLRQGGRLFNSLFVFENYPVPTGAGDENGPLSIKFRSSAEKLDYPLGVIAAEQGAAIRFNIKYAAELFDETVIAQLLSGVELILEQLTTQQDITTASLVHLRETQYQQMIFGWNNTANDYPADKTIHQLFEEQAAATPDAIALVYEDVRLSYAELNAKANQLAAYMRLHYKLKPDDLVALYLDRSAHMVMAILAVLKAGAAYVPIDIAYPDDRIGYILSDTATRLVLTNEVYQHRLIPLTTATVAAMDSNTFVTTLATFAVDNLYHINAATNLAYVMYTSGTTGIPKGVMVEHRSVNRLVKNIDYVDFTVQDHVLAIANYAFDGSVFDIFGALLNGGQLVIAPEWAALDRQQLENLIVQHQISICFITTSLFHRLVDENLSCLNLLKYIVAGGEQLSYTHAVKFLEQTSTVKLVNGYGPTESTTFATTYLCNNYQELSSGILPIGRPINNTTAYILDTERRPVPVGAVGELYLGGAGIARGYLKRPELTEERFVANPFGHPAGNGKLYKTGDLARYQPDGNIEYMGRTDFQVKLRGFRIEPGEIESCLKTYPGIRQAIVLVRENPDGNKYLAGYYTTATVLEKDGVIAHLKERLPEYMVPAALIALDALPLTINGKTDIKALPDPGNAAIREYTPPENELQQQLADIWQQLLGVQRIGIYDDFFELGGHSLLTMQMSTHIRKLTGLNVSLKRLFQCRDISQLSAWLGILLREKQYTESDTAFDIFEL